MEQQKLISEINGMRGKIAETKESGSVLLGPGRTISRVQGVILQLTGSAVAVLE